MGKLLPFIAIGCLAWSSAVFATEVEAHLRIGTLSGTTEPVGAGVVDASVPGVAGWIPIQMATHSLTALTAWTNGLSPLVGKANPGEFIFRKKVDFASPSFIAAIVTGRQFDQVELAVRYRGAVSGPFYAVMLRNLFVTSLAHDCTTTENPHEEVRFVFAGIEWLHQSLDDKGGVAFTSRFNWNIATGEASSGPMSGVIRANPFAGPDRVTRLSVGGITFPLASLLANDGADAGFLRSNPESALGGRISVADDQITYTPPTPDQGLPDEFRYTVRNLAGDLGEGVVTVAVRKVKGPELNVGLVRQRVDISLNAEAGLRYQLQYSDRLGYTWTDFENPITALANGEIHWTLEQPDTRFYRAVVLP